MINWTLTGGILIDVHTPVLDVGPAQEQSRVSVGWVAQPWLVRGFYWGFEPVDGGWWCCDGEMSDPYCWLGPPGFSLATDHQMQPPGRLQIWSLLSKLFPNQRSPKNSQWFVNINALLYGFLQTKHQKSIYLNYKITIDLLIFQYWPYIWIF